MEALTVFKFPTADGADTMLNTLQGLQSQQLLEIHDGAVVTWPEGAKKPKTRQLNSLTGIGALGGAFWGMLFGLLFFIPIIGLAIGAGMGALMASMSDVGIDDKFINTVRQKITPGTSALFLMTSNVVVERVAAAVKSMPMELISTNLSAEQEKNLRDAFGEDETTPPAPAVNASQQAAPQA